jgi:hypothetical protein
MNDLIVFEEDNSILPAVYAGMDVNDDLSDGVGGSYAILSLKGSRFQVKWQGNTTIVTDANGDPVSSYQAVIVKANKAITKQYYEKGFTEGDSEAPNCWSLDGKFPAAQVERPVHSNCAACPMNAFGSRINPQTGAKSKACADNRKLAVLPLGDLANELFGGPMLFRVAATALKDLAQFSDTLKARGFPYNAVAVRIGFDTSVSYPKPVFKAIRPLTEAEAEEVVAWYKSEQVEKVLGLEFGAPKTPPAEQPALVDDVFEQPVAATPAPAKKTAPPPPPAVKPAAAKPAVATQTAPLPVKAPAPAPKKAPVAKPPAAPPVNKTEPEPIAASEETEQMPASNMEDDIASILGELNSIATE